MTDPIDPLDVWELAHKHAIVQGEAAVRQLPRLAAELPDSQDRLHYRFAGDIDQLGRPAAVLELSGVVHVSCDRCGQPVAVPIDEKAPFFFVADEAELARLPIDEAADEPLLGSQHFDLAALIEDQAILALPISPRHPGCQAAEEPARREAGDGPRRPFAVLETLRKRGH